MLSNVPVVLANTALPLVTAGLVWLIVHAALWLKSKTHSQTIANGIDLVSHFATVVVNGLEATLRPTLAAPGAKLDAAGRKLIAQAALQEIKANLATEGSAAAKAALGIGDTYLSNFIETAASKLAPSTAAK